MRSTFEEEINKNGVLVYKNVGVSMLPLIKQNRDVLIIEKPTRTIKKYDVVLYKRPNGEYVLHRVIKVKNGQFVMCGDNQNYKEYGITNDNVLWILTSIERSGKVIKINEGKNKIYAHLITDFYPVRFIILRIRNYCSNILSHVKKKSKIIQTDFL